MLKMLQHPPPPLPTDWRFCVRRRTLASVQFKHWRHHTPPPPLPQKALPLIFSTGAYMYTQAKNFVLAPLPLLFFFLPRATGHGAREKSSHIHFWFWQQKQQKTTKATKITRVKRVLSKQHVRNACCPEQQNATNKLSSHQMFQVRNKSWNLVIF